MNLTDIVANPGRIDIVQVLDDKGRIILHDIYIDGVWHGSRRTKKQAMQYIRHVSPPPLSEFTVFI